MSRRGHTLYELMVSLALIGTLAALCAALAAGARRDDALARGYVDDLRHVRRASDLLASAVRGAARVETDGAALLTDGVRWTVENDNLLRDEEVAVRGVTALASEPTGAGAWRLSIAPAPRRTGARPPALTTIASPRVTEGLR